MKKQIRDLLRAIEAVKFKGPLGSKKILDNYMMCLAGGYKDAYNQYLEFNLRPQAVEQVTICSELGISQDDTAIVLQGPLVLEDNYTIETVRLYKRTCPGAAIVVSTWDDSSYEACQRIEAEGADIVLSPLPKHNGVGNVNYQVVSTMAGLKAAKNMGCKRALKCRTDQRLARINLLAYFDGLLQIFPVDDSKFRLGQRERIVYGQGTIGGSVFLPFYLCDWYMYGNIDDLISLFNFPLQQFTIGRSERIQQVEDLKTCCNLLEYHSRLAPEMILTRSYVTKRGSVEIPNTVASSWDFIRANLVCVSHQDVQHHWPKYRDRVLLNNTDFGYIPCDGPEKYLTYNWTFQNWLCLYLGVLPYSESYEKIPLLPATTV